MLYLLQIDDAPPAPTFTVVNPAIVQPLIWLAIFLTAAVIGYFVAKSVRRNLAWGLYVNLVGPFMLPLLWLYGLFFASPRNYALLKSGFFAFWLRPRNFSSNGLSNNFGYLLVLSLLAVFCLICAGLLVKRLYEITTGGPVFGFITLILWVLAGFSLWVIPYYILDNLTYANEITEEAMTIGAVGLIATVVFSFAAYRLAVFAAKLNQPT